MNGPFFSSFSLSIPSESSYEPVRNMLMGPEFTGVVPLHMKVSNKGREPFFWGGRGALLILWVLK